MHRGRSSAVRRNCGGLTGGICHLYNCDRVITLHANAKSLAGKTKANEVERTSFGATVRSGKCKAVHSSEEEARKGRLFRTNDALSPRTAVSTFLGSAADDSRDVRFARPELRVLLRHEIHPFRQISFAASSNLRPTQTSNTQLLCVFARRAAYSVCSRRFFGSSSALIRNGSFRRPTRQAEESAVPEVSRSAGRRRQFRITQTDI